MNLIFFLCKLCKWLFGACLHQHIGIKCFLSKTSAAGAAGLVAYAGYGAWVSLSPVGLVQLVSILLLGLIVLKQEITSQLLIIGVAICLL